jgi:hypothetical protein
MAKAPTKIRSLARSHTATAIKILAGIMSSPEASDAARICAANSLLDRGWGKPAQAIIGGDDNDNPIAIVNRIELVPLISDDSTQD